MDSSDLQLDNDWQDLVFDLIGDMDVVTFFVFKYVFNRG